MYTYYIIADGEAVSTFQISSVQVFATGIVTKHEHKNSSQAYMALSNVGHTNCTDDT